jgi:transketolase
MARAISNKPSVIISHTIPGKGVDFMEYDYHWHGYGKSPADYTRALTKLRTLNGKITSGDMS